MSVPGGGLVEVDLQKQIEHLEAQGMSFEDQAYARVFLQRVGLRYFADYAAYRMAEVRRGQIASYRPGTTFAQIEKAIAFDEKLKDHVMVGMRTIELWLRSTLTYDVSHRLGDPAWHLHVLELNEHTTRNDRSLLQSQTKKAEGKLKLPPDQPLWMIQAELSFSFWSCGYAILPTSEKIKIADKFGLHPSTLANWLRQIVGVRNICSHHHLLWAAKRMSAMAPADGGLHAALTRSIHMPSRERIECPALRLYAVHHILTRIDPKSQEWVQDLKRIVTEAPVLSPMGLRPDWERQPEWD